MVRHMEEYGASQSDTSGQSGVTRDDLLESTKRLESVEVRLGEMESRLDGMTRWMFELGNRHE